MPNEKSVLDRAKEAVVVVTVAAVVGTGVYLTTNPGNPPTEPPGQAKKYEVAGKEYNEAGYKLKKKELHEKVAQGAVNPNEWQEWCDTVDIEWKEKKNADSAAAFLLFTTENGISQLNALLEDKP